MVKDILSLKPGQDLALNSENGIGLGGVPGRSPGNLDTYVNKSGKCTQEPPESGELPSVRRELRRTVRYMQYARWQWSPVARYMRSVGSPNIKEVEAIMECRNTIKVSDAGQSVGPLTFERYCGSRFCPHCSRWRSKVLGRRLAPVFEEHPDGWEFVTLTRPNTRPYDVSYAADIAELKDYIRECHGKLMKVKDSVRKELGMSVDGIAAMEVRRRVRHNYHVHFHIIVPVGVGARIVKHWMRLNPEADERFQDVRPCDGAGALKELLKYVTAPIDKPKRSKVAMIELGGLDVLMSAMKGTRRLMSWGMFYDVKKIREDVQETSEADMSTLERESQIYKDWPVHEGHEGAFIVYRYIQEVGDYVCTDFGVNVYLTGQPMIKRKPLFTYEFGKRWRPPMYAHVKSWTRVEDAPVF